MERILCFADEGYEYDWWHGERLTGTAASPIAFDLETALIREITDGVTDPRDVPAIALGMAWDGEHLVLIHPGQLSEFVRLHHDQHIVGHNIAFDFWCLHRHLEGVGDSTNRYRLWYQADRGRVHDTLVLDLLIQLATARYRGGGYGDDAKLYPTNLGQLADDYGVGDIDKSDPYRLRYGELIGLSVAEIDRHRECDGFYSYALCDVLATRAVYQKQYRQALALMRATGWQETPTPTYEIFYDAAEKWGPLSEAIQVRASIALTELSRTPLHIDRDRHHQYQTAVTERYQQALQRLETETPTLFKRYKAKRFNGRYMVTAKTAVPRMDTAVLKAKLTEIASRLRIEPPISPGKQRGLSTSAKAWQPYADRDPWLKAWCDLEYDAKQLEFYAGLDADVVYSRYDLMKRTGRTSAGAWRNKKGVYLPSLNVQQMPKGRANDYQPRDVIVPRPGNVFIIYDYSYLELRTLAASALAQLGQSKLYETIIQHTRQGGADPHQRLAATILGVTLDEYFKLPKDKQKNSRQNSKIANFGFSGGLGADKFIGYAEASYGITFTKDQAKELKEAWWTTYPEMRQWLRDRTRDALRYQLQHPLPGLRSVDDWKLRKVNDLCRGSRQSAEEAAVAWGVLEQLADEAGDDDVLENVYHRRLTDRIRRLTRYRACTLTGLVRGDTKYTDGNNLPFQGLAAAGGKEAVWRLMFKGYHVVAFVHDEIIVEVPRSQAATARRDVERIMNEAMESVMRQGLPCAVEGVVADRWQKP